MKLFKYLMCALLMLPILSCELEPSSKKEYPILQSVENTLSTESWREKRVLHSDLGRFVHTTKTSQKTYHWLLCSIRASRKGTNIKLINETLSPLCQYCIDTYASKHRRNLLCPKYVQHVRQVGNVRHHKNSQSRRSRSYYKLQNQAKSCYCPTTNTYRRSSRRLKCHPSG